MESKKSWISILARFAICFGVFCITAIVLLVSFATVSGSANLPNGTVATINGPFSCSNNSGTTVIEAGGHVFEFSPTSITVDKALVAPLDSVVTSVEIDASYWTATLQVNGSKVPLVR